MIILKNARILQFDPPKISNNTDIAIEDDRIVKTGENLADQYHDAYVMDLQGKYVSPGLVCSHNHFYSALARGILANIPPSTSFVNHLQNLWWRLDRALDEEALYYSGLIGALEAIKTGTTAVIDHHASPSFIRGSLNTLKKSFEKVGLRGIFAYEITDRNGEKGAMDGVAETVEFIRSLENVSNANTPRQIESAIGGHAPFTLSDETLKLMSDAVEETRRGIHMHVSEDRHDLSFSHHQYRKDPVQRLADFGLLNEKTILVHGLYLTEQETNLLNQSDGFLVHNPRSNMNNGVGYMNNLHRIKNPVLGTDGIGANMWEELKFAFFKNNDAGGKLNLPDFPGILQNGNKILERYFGQKFGQIEEGYTADLVILDYHPPTPFLEENLAGHLIFGFSSRDVETVIVNGKVIFQDRQFKIDISQIYAEAQKQAERLWGKMDKL